MPIYDVVTSFGVIQYEADNIKEARAWAKKAHKVGPRSVSIQTNYKLCERCDCKPCCCSEEEKFNAPDSSKGAARQRR